MKNSMKNYYGFTLIEMSLVLLIMAFTLSSLLFPLSSKLEERSINKTKIQINNLKESVLNFVLIHYRLPCPDIDQDGLEDMLGVNCSDINGNIPYVTLGSPHIQDPWGERFLYQVSPELADNNNINTCATAPAGVSIAICSALNEGTINVFSYTAAGAQQPAAIGVAAIILSTGKNTGINGVAQNENTDNDADFVKTGYGDINANIPFNDIVIWITVNELIAKLIEVEVLP